MSAEDSRAVKAMPAWKPATAITLVNQDALDNLSPDQAFFGNVQYIHGTYFGVADADGMATAYAPFEQLVSYDYNNYPNQRLMQEVRVMGRNGPLRMRRSRDYGITVPYDWSAWSAWVAVVY